MGTELLSSTDPGGMGVRDSRMQETLVELSELVGRKWQLIIVYQLLRHDGLGFSDLKDDIDGISGKVLANNLEDLQEKGLIHRATERTRPFRVEYTVTERGRELAPLIETIRREYAASNGTGTFASCES